MAFLFEHTALGFCFWDIPALLVLIGMVVIVIRHNHNRKEEIRELEEQLSGIYAAEAVTGEQ